jgi:hypothetical protein
MAHRRRLLGAHAARGSGPSCITVDERESPRSVVVAAGFVVMKVANEARRGSASLRIRALDRRLRPRTSPTQPARRDAMHGTTQRRGDAQRQRGREDVGGVARLYALATARVRTRL